MVLGDPQKLIHIDTYLILVYIHTYTLGSPNIPSRSSNIHTCTFASPVGSGSTPLTFLTKIGLNVRFRMLFLRNRTNSEKHRHAMHFQTYMHTYTLKGFKHTYRHAHLGVQTYIHTYIHTRLQPLWASGSTPRHNSQKIN